MSSVRVNPYRLFNLPEPGLGVFTDEELKQSMRKLILVTHPDKPTGSAKKFRVVMKCYKYLTGVLRERLKTTRTVNTGAIEESRLLRESEQVDIPASNFIRFSNDSGESFDLKGFNSFFDENQLGHPMERGHGDWLKESDPEAEKRAKERVAKGTFDKMFEEERKRILKENRIVRHTGLQSAYQSLNGTSLDEVESYSGMVKTRHGLVGVDVREAHEYGIIAVDDPKYSGASGSVSIDQAKREREGTSLKETEEDKILWEREFHDREERDRIRRQRIKEQEREIQEHFTRVNKTIGDI